MEFKKVHFIINPASGKDEPILSYIHKAFSDTGIEWKVTVTNGEDDAVNAASELAGHTDLIVVYGGDGSITQVARALMGTNTPMAIIPGGTANVMSKELGISQDSEEALKMITGGNAQIIKMDMGEANGTPFLLRINLGIMADMILDADKQLKARLGQVAYGVTALKTIVAATPTKYKLEIDGQQVDEEGVSLTVTNAGNIGIGDMSFLPGISITDGYLDVILMKDAGLLSLLQVAGSTLFQKESDVLKHWCCKQIKINLDGPAQYICDDCEEEADSIDIKNIASSIEYFDAHSQLATHVYQDKEFSTFSIHLFRKDARHSAPLHLWNS